MIDISHSEEIYSISRLNREVRFLLEGSFASIWVEGEISNFVAPHSGHWYFSLKDSTAQVRCAMFKSQNRLPLFTPKDGMHVIAKVNVSLYEGRGNFQLIVEHLEEAGIGKLQKEFEALKKRLAEAGLFDKAHKKTLPNFPCSIGVITSTTGAAIQDILNVLKRRFCCASVIIYSTLVQGELAAIHIVNAIKTADQRKECDVLILARGGGSLEDLWPFNEEIVAHAIYHCELPIITGIGHEIDFTIADFVADIRAPTPSAAAELVTPNAEELLATISTMKQHLLRIFKQYLQQLQQKLVWITKHLHQHHPKRRLAEQMQQLDFYQSTLYSLQFSLIEKKQAALQNTAVKLHGLTPQHRIREQQQHLELYQQQILNKIHLLLQNQLQFISHLAAKLNTLSPLSTLKRGYAIATLPQNKIIRSIDQLKPGQIIEVQLIDGIVECGVQGKYSV